MSLTLARASSRDSPVLPSLVGAHHGLLPVYVRAVPVHADLAHQGALAGLPAHLPQHLVTRARPGGTCVDLVWMVAK